MVTELALERVEFTCGHCWHQWSTGYEAQHYCDDDGRDREYFVRGGTPVDSPYTPEGALPCPECERPWVGHLLARRLIPTPLGLHGTPRQPIADVAGHRPDRHARPRSTPRPTRSHRDGERLMAPEGRRRER
ncbi:hypothetical protein ACH4E7_38395 [Kitasatospora sp. NPDC018058]|uniref:hypothetical protein n=1 Tax=Kitasatospora sp. NPDC018058 TaxID=3364025 RepID=UPI0037BF797C